MVVCLVAFQSSAQERPPDGPQPLPERPAPPPLPTPPPSYQGAGAPLSAYPIELFGLLNPRISSPVVLTPSLTVSEEYNDNIFFNNANKEADFKTEFTPAFTLIVNKRILQLYAGYSFTSALYANNPSFDNAVDHQALIVNGLYQATPKLAFTLNEWFTTDNSANFGPQGFVTTRQKTLTNSISPGLAWLITPVTSLSLSATYGFQEFQGQGSGVNSNSYGFHATLEHSFTARFSTRLNYTFLYLDLENQQNSTTHTPEIGVTYRFTPTLSATAQGGVAISEISNQTTYTPAGSVTLDYILSFGWAKLLYSRGVDVAGPFGGTTDTQTVAGALALTTLFRNFVLAFSPSYSQAVSVSNQQTGQVDVQQVTMRLGMTYEINRYVTIFGSYTFLRERTGGSSTDQVNADQNRVKFGVQLGYPISLF